MAHQIGLDRVRTAATRTRRCSAGVRSAGRWRRDHRAPARDSAPATTRDRPRPHAPRHPCGGGVHRAPRPRDLGRRGSSVPRSNPRGRVYDRAVIDVEGGSRRRRLREFRREAHVPKGGPEAGRGRGGMSVADSPLRDSRPAPGRPSAAGGGATGRASAAMVRAATRRASGRPRDRDYRPRRGAVDLTDPGSARWSPRRGSGGTEQALRDRDPPDAPIRRARAGGRVWGWIELRLRLLADVGLVGLRTPASSPSDVTRAAPKVADYPFTTVEPVPGRLEVDDR